MLGTSLEANSKLARYKSFSAASKKFHLWVVVPVKFFNRQQLLDLRCLLCVGVSGVSHSRLMYVLTSKYSQCKESKTTTQREAWSPPSPDTGLVSLATL